MSFKDIQGFVFSPAPDEPVIRFLEDFAATGGHEAASADISADETGEIKERLRELGYLG